MSIPFRAVVLEGWCSKDEGVRGQVSLVTCLHFWPFEVECPGCGEVCCEVRIMGLAMREAQFEVVMRKQLMRHRWNERWR